MSRGRPSPWLLAVAMSCALAAPGPALSGPIPAAAPRSIPTATPAASSPLGSGEAPDPYAIVALLAKRNAALESYTFDLHVKIALRTFPWLQPDLIGSGSYRRPGRYVVTFKEVPVLAKQYQQVSGVMLDPGDWPQKYAIAVGEQRGPDVELILHERVKGEITEARALVDVADGSVRSMHFLYAHGGTIDIRQRTRSIDGFVLPVEQDADIVMPGIKATAHATIFNYHLKIDDAQPGGTAAVGNVRS